jgi:hypothetical protein
MIQTSLKRGTETAKIQLNSNKNPKSLIIFLSNQNGRCSLEQENFLPMSAVSPNSPNHHTSL